jgi:hypothetical protein
VSSSDDDGRHKKVVIENDGDTLQELYLRQEGPTAVCKTVFPGNCMVGEWDRDSRLIRSVSVEFSHVAQRARPIKDRVLSVSSCWIAAFIGPHNGLSN